MNSAKAITGAFLFGLCGSMSFAQTSTTANGQFSLQGRLTTTAGALVANGPHMLSLKVYKAGTSTLVYSEVDNVVTTNGIFTTVVGDNGSGEATLLIDSKTSYELGVAFDNEMEMLPRLRIGSAIKAAVADVAALATDARAVAGFMVDTTGVLARSLVTTDANGRLRASQIANSAVTSINGLRGPVNIQLTGSGVTIDTIGGVLHMNIAGGSGGFTLPYAANSQALAIGDVFAITNTLGGTTAAFTNVGTGIALRAQATENSAIQATSAGASVGSATIMATNTAGTAINAVGATATDAVLRLRNNATAVGAKLISGTNAAGAEVLGVASSGRTTIMSTVANALEVTTMVAGDVAMKLNGGLALVGPVGTGTIDLATGSVVVANAFARANSIIMLTITSIAGVTTAVPLRVSSQGTSTFTVSAIPNGLGALTGTYSFNYLIINQ